MDINPLDIWRPFERQSKTKRAANVGVSSVRSLAGGRVSMDNPTDYFSSGLSYLAPFSADEYWRSYSLDAKTLDRTNPTKLMELLADASPEVSRALWDFILMCNPGNTAKAYKLGTKEEHGEGQIALDSFLGNLHGPYSVSNVAPKDVVIGSLFMQPFMRGAFFSELVLDSNARMPLEIATPDPAYVQFKKIADSERGGVWQAYQMQAGEEVWLDRPTVCYIPVHPFPGKPYGRPLASPALFTTIFLLSILHDIRRVIQQQGWPRIDIAVKFEELVKMMPSDDAADSTKSKAWLEGAFQDIMEAYNGLEPDDAYVHPDAVTVNQPVGAMNASGLGAVDGIVKGLERMATRALKTMPLLMATTDGVSEANANRQWEIHAAGIKALQHLCETMLERLLTLALQVQGISANVSFKFAELRAAEEQRDAQTRKLKIDNEARIRDEGWQTQDEAANIIVGHDAVSPTPIRQAVSDTSDLMNTKPDPGSDRAQQQALLLWRTYQIETNYIVSFNQWWRERLDNPSTYDEAWERLKERLGRGLPYKPDVEYQNGGDVIS